MYLFIALSLTFSHCCSGYLIEGEIPEGIFSENETAIGSWFDFFNDTDSNTSLPRELREFVKNIIEKIKDSIKDVKDNLGSDFDKIKEKIKIVKDTIKDGFDRIRKKIKNFKDISGKKDQDDEVVRKDDDDKGNGSTDSNAKWFTLGLGVFAIMCIVMTIIYHAMKNVSSED
ncbi:hypothetical protein NPIL_148651 [Nephila pilipes]|uniref:Spider venom protein n=1 Tax=Nephila pilipes TaxID=299642 RepID=A0A8X6PWT8_NEPPI|nr:hypothetical protein NPIL_148651 [Nephila pilipes]